MENEVKGLDIKLAMDWFDNEGKFIFSTPYSWEWFKRQHAVELVEADALILGRGRASDKVTSKINQACLYILKRQSLESAKRLEQK